MNILNEDGSNITFTNAEGVVVNLEYRYLEYDISGYVVKIYNELPESVATGNMIAIASNQNFEEGSEYTNYIMVQAVNEVGTLTSSFMAKQPQSVVFLRQERDKLAETLLEAQNAINDALGVV